MLSCRLCLAYRRNTHPSNTNTHSHTFWLGPKDRVPLLIPGGLHLVHELVKGLVLFREHGLCACTWLWRRENRAFAMLVHIRAQGILRSKRASRSWVEAPQPPPRCTGVQGTEGHTCRPPDSGPNRHIPE
ncbi:hypothetical protein F751_3832 [Auxenochlorella protothecoides]|uniref:Uncharacterized protein n=1 Tax=Auxenochlorella protothecoides TaxID=3075 RepID=A0A087SRG8_AUXPR|nr:hypothetical protein F751_3832 [Auxenochlorella protothecoides]KFM28322.1 hypothetical protein F751_3832 [Auxenochlorella protothecoides]